MSAILNIEDLVTVLADESQFPALKGPRDARNPGWIFFDDEREEDQDILWGRELALDFEEYVAKNSDFNEESVPQEAEEYFDRLDSRARARWLINFHKTSTNRSSNDNYHKLIAAISGQLLDREEKATSPIKKQIATTNRKQLLSIIKEKAKYAPGPVAGTVFINPDGSKFATNGLNPTSAKAAYIKRHKLDEEFVSVDRVQREGERTSKWVVGVRRTSDQTPSNYYDANPVWREQKRNGQWVKAYDPGARNLYMMRESSVMPFGAHRLTVREFEQAVIAGAETMEDEVEAFASTISMDFLPDYRVSLLNMGYGSNGKDESALTHQEAYLYGLLRMFGHDQACELMLLEDQEEGLLSSFFMHKGEYTDELIDILTQVARDDEPRKDKKTGEALPAVNEEPMLAWVSEILTGIKQDA